MSNPASSSQNERMGNRALGGGVFGSRVSHDFSLLMGARVRYLSLLGDPGTNNICHMLH